MISSHWPLTPIAGLTEQRFARPAIGAPSCCVRVKPDGNFGVIGNRPQRDMKTTCGQLAHSGIVIRPFGYYTTSPCSSMNRFPFRGLSDAMHNIDRRWAASLFD